MKSGIWLDFPKHKPKDGDLVLIHKRGYSNCWDKAIYNERCKCWDDANMDDFMCNANDVDKFMIIPNVL
jgi:hypothetical protein